MVANGSAVEANPRAIAASVQNGSALSARGAERVVDRRETVEAGVEAGQLEQLALPGRDAGQRQARVPMEALVEADEHAESHRVHVGELREVEHVARVALAEQLDQGELQMRGGGEVEIALDGDDAGPLVDRPMSEPESLHHGLINGRPRRFVTGVQTGSTNVRIAEQRQEVVWAVSAAALGWAAAAALVQPPQLHSRDAAADVDLVDEHQVLRRLDERLARGVGQQQLVRRALRHPLDPGRRVRRVADRRVLDPALGADVARTSPFRC